MKKAISLITISFLLIITTNLHAQISRRTTTLDSIKKTHTIDPKNLDRKQVKRPNLENLKVTHFTRLSSGNPSDRYGAIELLVADRLFPVLNTTNITLKGKTTTTIEMSTVEDLSINVNLLDFSYFSESVEPWLKPGQVISSKSFISRQPRAVKTQRNPITLTIDLPGAPRSSYEVLNPHQESTLLNAENTLINQGARVSAPKLSFSFHKIHSEEEMEFKLNGKFRSIIGVLNAFSYEVGLSNGNQQAYHYYMLEFRQPMFSIRSGDMPPNIFKEFIPDMSDHVYIDKVDYGRKGIIIFRSTRTLEELNIKGIANYHYGLTENEMRSVYKQLKNKKEIEVFARIYGGSSAQDLLSIANKIKIGVPDIFTYLASLENNHRLAVPVSYSLKNLNNQVIGQKSKKTQTITTKTPIPPPSNNKLKVTLTDIHSIKGYDKDHLDDFGIQQYIVYKALGKEKKYASRQINKFPERIDMPGQVPNIINPLIKGDMNNQIHVWERTRLSMRNRDMIDNSLIFHITSEELNDPKASFEIFTWLKEYSSDIINGRMDWTYMDNKSVKVKIKDVVEILQGRIDLNENTTIPELGIVEEVRFHNFGFDFMKLANIRKKKPLVLEGPIYHIEKKFIVAVWVQFELIE